MSKTKFRMTRASIVDERTNVYTVEHKNCDTLVGQIKTFYESYEQLLSLEDKKKLLDVLLRIQYCQKTVSRTEKNDMYKVFQGMKLRYRGR